MSIAASDELAKKFCDALGLKHCYELLIHFKVGEVSKVTATFYPEKFELRRLPKLLQEFKLEPISEAKEVPEVIEITCIGDEINQFEYKVVK